MNKTLVTLLVSFFVAGLIQYSKGQNVSGTQQLKIEKQVDSAFHAMIKAAENFTYDQLNNGVDDSHKAGFIVNGSYFEKFDSLLNVVKARSQNVNGQTISLQKEKITLLTPNVALLSAYGITKIDMPGTDPFTVKFFWSFVYEKTNNDWKVIQSHQSSIR